MNINRLKKVNTYQIQIFCGLREGYTSKLRAFEEAKSIVQAHVDGVGLCVSITETQFIYTNGYEPGLVIGLINYPRFPSEKEALLSKAMELAEKLMDELKQYRVSVVTPEHTYLLENPSLSAQS